MTYSKPISNHTASLGFSGAEDEVDLILSRAAVFTQPASINFMTICPLYRERLGLGWRLRGVKCHRHYPIMTEEAKSGRNATEESGKLILI